LATVSATKKKKTKKTNLTNKDENKEGSPSSSSEEEEDEEEEEEEEEDQGVNLTLFNKDGSKHILLRDVSLTKTTLADVKLAAVCEWGQKTFKRSMFLSCSKVGGTIHPRWHTEQTAVMVTKQMHTCTWWRPPHPQPHFECILTF
jgi:hypothetical protein